MAIDCRWRGTFTSVEANELHAAAFGTRVFTDEEWNWVAQTAEHSLGWVTARDAETLVGFVNVVWDGSAHAWLQDVMVSPDIQRRGVGEQLVHHATLGARSAGCEWLHVDFDDHHSAFYIDRCGFTRAAAGLLRLN
mgnify:CR=1 FL=1